MNDLQKMVLKKYMEIYKNPSLKFISEDTKIQITRVFRIINGSEMKITEYEKFIQSIKKNNSYSENEKVICDSIEKAIYVLPENTLYEIANYLERKISYKSLNEEKNNKLVS